MRPMLTEYAQLARPRIKTRQDALRCLDSIKEYLRRQESPLAAEDLEDSMALLFQGIPETV